MNILKLLEVKKRMEINIEIERAEKPKQKTKRKEQQAVVYFPGTNVRWIPTYDQIINILHRMSECEANNQEMQKIYGEKDGNIF